MCWEASRMTAHTHVSHIYSQALDQNGRDQASLSWCDIAETRDYDFVTLSEKIVKREKLGPLIYKKLIGAKNLTPGKNQQKWLQDCDYSDQEQPAYLTAP